MTDWSKYPFVRILIPFALGIWVRHGSVDGVFVEASTEQLVLWSGYGLLPVHGRLFVGSSA